MDSYRSPYQQQAQCSLASIEKNFQNFGKGTSGGTGNYWSDWFELTQKDQNNYMGSYFLARDQMGDNIAYNQNMNRLEITIGKGFLDMKKCPNNEKTCAESAMEHTTPGSEVQSQLDRVLNIEGQRINVQTSIDTLLSALMNNLMKRAVTSLQDQGK